MSGVWWSGVSDSFDIINQYIVVSGKNPPELYGGSGGLGWSLPSCDGGGGVGIDGGLSPSGLWGGKCGS